MYVPRTKTMECSWLGLVQRVMHHFVLRRSLIGSLRTHGDPCGARRVTTKSAGELLTSVVWTQWYLPLLLFIQHLSRTIRTLLAYTCPCIYMYLHNHYQLLLLVSLMKDDKPIIRWNNISYILHNQNLVNTRTCSKNNK